MLSKLSCAAAFMFSVAFVAVMSAHTSAMFNGSVAPTVKVLVSVLGWGTFLSGCAAIFFTVLEGFLKGKDDGCS